jgi:hypothetical protein
MFDFALSSLIRPMEENGSKGVVKCYMDVAIFQEHGCYDIAMCLRGEQSEYLAAKTTWFKGTLNSREIEV